MAGNINEYFADNGYNAVVTARGAVDMELGYGGPVMTRHWADAYNAVLARPGYANFGDAAGCQDFENGDYTACGSPPFDTHWSSSDVHYVSWGVLAAFPLPQIYRDDGKQAEQWVMISKWGYDTNNGEMGFQAPLTQDQACGQKGGCSTTRNTPLMAWNQMDAKMDAKPNTKVQMRFSTDIKVAKPRNLMYFGPPPI